ncbi:hypothetical protein JHK82_013334 [Glycine max]|nr:hypothetical protein GLYMA_05G184300v4 [Glycine max]KAG5029742.1 hypothetical protein JHK87_013256 [Glycine soja]KAG5041226.1 hypothetical protein JHK85_013702 [Glycine max]KAG5058363.1 hypothetical protein JHK86_013359 [Glycine max]KAG5155365.1 hypothetical protein JHK82_013334 [Glycine max]
MDKFSRTILFFLLFCVLIILQFQRATPDHEKGGQNVAQGHPEKPLLSKMLMDTVSLLRKSHQSSWEKIKTVIHDLQMQFSPPNLEGTGWVEYDGSKGTFKEAVEKIFGKSKETVEESAEGAAKVVEEAIHKTTEKVKESSHSEHESKAEL